MKNIVGQNGSCHSCLQPLHVWAIKWKWKEDKRGGRSAGVRNISQRCHKKSAITLKHTHTRYKNRHVGMDLLSWCYEWISSMPNISRKVWAGIFCFQRKFVADKILSTGAKCWLSDRDLRSIIGASIPQVLQKTCVSSYEREWKGRGSWRAKARWNRVSTHLPLNLMWVDYLYPLTHTHTHRVHMCVCMFPALLLWLLLILTYCSYRLCAYPVLFPTLKLRQITDTANKHTHT